LQDTVAHALNGMTAWGNRHLPIVDDEERLVGFVSVRRVLRHLRRHCLDPA
jgi:CBS-domain-containing membrane protein